jgi:hypothetical protein
MMDNYYPPFKKMDKEEVMRNAHEPIEFIQKA